MDIYLFREDNTVRWHLIIEFWSFCRYFQRLVYQFEQDMVLCRQQIEQMESFMAALDQPVSYSPQGNNVLLRGCEQNFMYAHIYFCVWHPYKGESYFKQGGPRGVLACRSNMLKILCNMLKNVVQYAKILWNILENTQQSY